MSLEITVASLTDHVQRTADGRTVSPVERVDQLVELGILVERLGLDGFALGEHHTADFAVSSPAVVLAAIAARTTSIRLGTAVTVLSALDPVRLYEDFATLDQISRGRAELTVGRGAFVEPFTLFGVPIDRYDEVFEEKLDLLLRLDRNDRVGWAGRFRPPLHDAEIWPRPVQPGLPVWVGVGGSPDSAERAGRLGLPMTIGSIGMTTQQLTALADTYRAAGNRYDTAGSLRLGVGVHFFAAESESEARAVYPYYRDFLAPKRPGSNGLNVTQDQFDTGFRPDVVRFIGSTDQLRDKLIALHHAVNFDRLQVLPDWGGLPVSLIEASLTRLTDTLAPAIRAMESR